jgi:hypothetical protein
VLREVPYETYGPKFIGLSPISSHAPLLHLIQG